MLRIGNEYRGKHTRPVHSRDQIVFVLSVCFRSIIITVRYQDATLFMKSILYVPDGYRECSKLNVQYYGIVEQRLCCGTQSHTLQKEPSVISAYNEYGTGGRAVPDRPGAVIVYWLPVL